MYTCIDEGKGLVKVFWSDIKERFSNVEPKFAELVNELNPNKTFPLFLAYYPYGVVIADTQSPFLPLIDQSSTVRLSDPKLPKEIIKNLGYGKNSLPFGMVLDKEFEYFLDLKSENVTIPWCINYPGCFFPYGRTLSSKTGTIYSPNGVLVTTSGVRSTFMLPNIGCAANHINLQRDYNVKLPPPKTLYEHWNVFKEIYNSNVNNVPWNSCIIYFGINWVNKILNDPAWMKLKLYLHERAWQAFEFERNEIYYNITFSLIQKKCNLKPNPYLVDTAKHLFTTALGVAPGFAPATTNDSLPLETIQKAFIESYGLKKYIPTVIQPINYNFKKNNIVYYSLQNPSTYVFSPKARKISSTLFEMRELEHIMRIFIRELSTENNICSDTILAEIAKKIEFKYYHNEYDRHSTIANSIELENLDKRFRVCNYPHKISTAKFASDSKFVRGCISIKRKTKS